MKIDTGIPETARKSIAEGLTHVLADSYSLYLKTHNYHWNVTGMMFQTLHLMFETQYTELALAVDLIAERIRALGEFAPGSYSEFSRLSEIKDDAKRPNAKGMIENLVLANETLIRTARKVLANSEKAGDQATTDLLTQRIHLHEKTCWMLRSLLEE